MHTTGRHRLTHALRLATAAALSAACAGEPPLDPDAIPWLLLRASADPGGGLFRGVTAIQRVNTVGGRAPSGAGATPGEVREVPYTAEYHFYRQR